MYRRRLGRLIGTFMLGAAVAGFSVQPSQAFDLSGKRVQIIVPFTEGGGTDVYVRFVAPILRQYLPGNPTINVLNQPGGGSVTGANRFERSAQPDGLTLLATSTSTIVNAVFDNPNVQYKPAEWEVITISPQGGVIFVSPTTGVSKPEEVKKLVGQRLVWGANTPRGADVMRLLMFDMLGFDMHVIFGTDSAPARQAFERGEFNIHFGTTPAFLSHVMPMVEAGKAVPIFSYGYIDDEGALVRDPGFPDLPHFGEAYETIHGKKPSGLGYEALLTLLNVQVMAAKSLSLPKGTPKEIVETYRAAMTKVLDDPVFKESQERILGDYPQSIGPSAQRIMANSAVMKPEAKEWLTGWLEKKYGVKP